MIIKYGIINIVEFVFLETLLKKTVNLYGLEKRMEYNNDDLTTILAKSNLLLFYSDL